MNGIDLIPQACLLDDICSRFEAVVRIGLLTPSNEVNKRIVRKSVRLQLRSHLCNQSVIKAIREHVSLISDQQISELELAYWRRTAEIEYMRDERSDIDIDDALLFAKFADVASQSILAALRGG